ncbi:DNA-binding transcriptional MerR regulator [Pacificibacter maritimus]|uniref:DNA-binding transcriptional MerR regulator n=1 Tax=Pacificibacter maritimus TaxID=762213 RepID=A0A3N4U6A7_9RHOB|nr:MerR family DNA-binding transcriptional regulator [Pacificibacter maritimus]RPE66323.1 DNA-binding transcriptional MerR regulator [Pacificibacter maritimus]
MVNDVMTIREMCEMYDVTPRTLRFYEAKELLFPKREGQKRLFTRRDRARLKLILRGKRFGFDLEKIRQLLDLYSVKDAGRAQMKDTLEAYQHRRVELIEQVKTLQQVIVELDTEIDWVQTELTKDTVEEQIY